MEYDLFGNIIEERIPRPRQKNIKNIAKDLNSLADSGFEGYESNDEELIALYEAVESLHSRLNEIQNLKKAVENNGFSKQISFKNEELRRLSRKGFDGISGNERANGLQDNELGANIAKLRNKSLDNEPNTQHLLPMIMSKNWELIIAMNEIAMMLSIDQILNHFKESFLITPYEIADQMIEQNNNLWSKYPYQQELLEAKMEYLDRAYGTWIFHRWTSALISKNQEDFILSLKLHEMKTFLAAAQMQEKVELMSFLTIEAQTLLKTGESLLEVLKKTRTDQFYCLWTKMLKIHKTMSGKNMMLARRDILLSY
nr:hypothetical protein [uncultured Campylobacter sp.]